MGRKLAATLAMALLTFVLVPMASADLITTPTGVVLIPNGSQVTSLSIISDAPFCNQVIEVSFQFQGGTGSTWRCPVDITSTSLNFTVPVTDLFITAVIPPTFSAQISLNGVTVLVKQF